MVGSPLPGQQYLLIEHPGLLFRLPHYHLLVEGTGSIDHIAIEEGYDRTDKDDEFRPKKDRFGELHSLSAHHFRSIIDPGTDFWYRARQMAVLQNSILS